MSKELARQRELNPMELCEPCKGIQRNWRKAPGHAELVQRGNRKDSAEIVAAFVRARQPKGTW